MMNLGWERSQLREQEVPMKSEAMTYRLWAFKEILKIPQDSEPKEFLQPPHLESSQALCCLCTTSNRKLAASQGVGPFH